MRCKMVRWSIATLVTSLGQLSTLVRTKSQLSSPFIYCVLYFIHLGSPSTFLVASSQPGYVLSLQLIKSNHTFCTRILRVGSHLSDNRPTLKFLACGLYAVKNQPLSAQVPTKSQLSSSSMGCVTQPYRPGFSLLRRRQLSASYVPFLYLIPYLFYWISENRISSQRQPSDSKLLA